MPGYISGTAGATEHYTPVDAQTIEAMPAREHGAHLARDGASYRTPPLPAESLMLRASSGGEAYAIYDVQDDRVYAYEFGGLPSGYAALWQEICAAGRTFYVNKRRGGAAQQWLARQPGIHWHDQALAMWLALAEPACARQFSAWYVPFLDRI